MVYQYTAILVILFMILLYNNTIIIIILIYITNYNNNYNLYTYTQTNLQERTSIQIPFLASSILFHGTMSRTVKPKPPNLKSLLLYDVKRALKEIGYILLPMPVFNEKMLNRTRTSKSNWTAILPDNDDSGHFNNRRDCQQRFQMHMTNTKTEHGVRLQYMSSAIRTWQATYGLSEWQLTRPALLRSLNGCRRQFFHADTAFVDTYKDIDVDKYYLGVVCCPFEAAKLYIR